MKITRVKIGLCDGDDRVKAYANITLDDCFIIHGLRLTHSAKKGYFLFMPGRKMTDGTYMDIVHPVSCGAIVWLQDWLQFGYTSTGDH